MAMEIYFGKRLSVITIILIYCLTDALCKLHCNEDNVNCDNGRVLSRKRRALTFPEGSSLQLVYDQTIPIVAAQLLFTVGVTCALAFELPSKPLYQITKELRVNLQMKLHPERFTTTTTTEVPNNSSSEEMIDYDDHHDHSRIDLNYNRLNFVNNKKNYYDVINKHKYYYSGGKPSYFSDKSDNFAATKNIIKSSNKTDVDSIWKKVIRQFVNKDGKKVTTLKFGEKKKGKKKLGNVFLRKHHRVYPVFGKRSVDDHLSEDDIFYMDHHRNTRFELYEKVENFLKGRGKDGTTCVLRALCETAQKNQSGEKAPFLIEILRAIFTLPHQVMPGYKKDSHQLYENAHSNLTADCAILYPQCKDSIWSPDFRF